MAPRKSNRTRNATNTTPPPNEVNQPTLAQLVAQQVAEAMAAAANVGSSTDTGDRAARPTNGSRGCTYKEFRACDPGSFGGIDKLQ